MTVTQLGQYTLLSTDHQKKFRTFPDHINSPTFQFSENPGNNNFMLNLESNYQKFYKIDKTN